MQLAHRSVQMLPVAGEAGAGFHFLGEGGDACIGWGLLHINGEQHVGASRQGLGRIEFQCRKRRMQNGCAIALMANYLRLQCRCVGRILDRCGRGCDGCGSGLCQGKRCGRWLRC